jgi:proteasome lid subunit RPN8/RPN11
VTPRRSTHSLVIARPALAAAEQAASSRLPRETGGILIGIRVGSDVYVADVAEVADDRSTGRRFVLPETAREEALARYRSDVPADCPFGYVGTWHSHPALAAGSSRDIKTLRHEAKAAHDLVAMMILMRAPDGEWLVDGALGHRKRVIAHRAGRRPAWRSIIAGADVIVRPASQPTPPGYGTPDGAGSEGST